MSIAQRLASVDPLRATVLGLGAYSGMRAGGQRNAPVTGALAGIGGTVIADQLFQRASATGNTRLMAAALLAGAFMPGMAGEMAGHVFGDRPVTVDSGPSRGQLGPKMASWDAGVRAAFAAARS